MKFKTELHCHTGHVSNCGEEVAEYIVERYLEAGYTSLMVADHMSPYTFDGTYGKYCEYLKATGKEDSWQTKIDFFLTGYENLVKAAAGRLNIILGMEWREFNSKIANDYLVFGVTEEWLRASETISHLKAREMSDFLHQSGMLLFQAHPFRNGMTIINPKYLDGIEVFNGHNVHQSRNKIAAMWADIHGLKRSSGSDFHEAAHVCCGGILTDTPIKNASKLLEVLKSENYELLVNYDIAP